MITLKAALIAASAVGAVAVGGGATWAMTGSHQEAGLQSGESKTAAVRQLKDVAPSPAPTCLPAKPGVPGVPGAKVPAGKLPTGDLPTGDLPTGNLPGAKLPDAKLPGGKVPDAKVPGGKLPDAKVPDARVPGVPLPHGKPPKDGLPKVEVPKPGIAAPGKPSVPGAPSTLPTCLPDAKQLPKGTPSTAPSPRVPGVPSVPGVPAVPAVPGLDCSKLPPAVKVGGPVEKAVMLPKGLRYVSTTPGSKALQKKKVCAVTQKWAGKAGQWLTVETLKTPAGMTQNQLRNALGLPGGGTPVTVGGAAAWQGPGGGGVLLFDPSGYSLFVNGSPVLAGGLQDVTAALRQAQ
ncbi:hypothetical protein [Actinomadura rubrisoli]|uniref:DUF3558 domain-containing protein n=1 Tax=Actinomadura rubrisoli TaxID=2530368 RepID=A0A4R5ALK0_9ACTN|nr:hypothetical protein [Actinomadura rubrisoli]TDD72795.1 hypothetical protein E1298_34860 [Actinomadura rubrisoli]